MPPSRLKIHTATSRWRKPMVTAVLDGASQIAVPTFVATLAICIVFVPVLLLTGTARYLFTPLAMAVVFAMLASYLLSRTLVPTMMAYLLGSEIHERRRECSAGRAYSSAATSFSMRHSKPCDTATSACWIGPCGIAGGCYLSSGPFFWRRWASLGWWARISSPRWIPARCGCTREVRPARESKRPRCGSPPSKARSGPPFRRTRSRC